LLPLWQKSGAKKEEILVQKSIYVIAGKEESLVNAECRELLGKLLEPEHRATGLFDADAASVSASEVLDELRTVPFLTDKRVVVIKGADDFVSENRQLLEKYFDNPSPTGVLILTVSNWSAKTNLAKQLSAVGKLISVTQPQPSQLPHRLCQYANDSYGKKLSNDAAALLVELAGDNLGRLYSEVDKLATFADKEKVITASHVELLIGHNRLFNAFAVIDAIMDGNLAEAVERLRRMFAEDKDSEYTVVGAFAFHFRRMFNAKVLLEKGLRYDEIAKKFQIWSNKDSFFARVRKVSLKQIGGYLQKLAEIDHAIKTGRTKPQVAMEQLVLGLVTGP
jgi:DNA polymerase III subunit delta